MEQEKVHNSAIRISTIATTTRQTPRTDFGSVMRDGLIRAGDVALQGMQVAAPFIPGGSIVSAALAGATGAAKSGSYGSSVSGLTGASTSLTGNGSGVQSSSTLAIPAASTTLSSNDSGSSDAFNQMMTATQQMAEFQASFNLQYLQLQEKIQIDTRQFNLISNIMKSKHDAAKNALNNVR